MICERAAHSEDALSPSPAVKNTNLHLWTKDTFLALLDQPLCHRYLITYPPLSLSLFFLLFSDLRLYAIYIYLP